MRQLRCLGRSLGLSFLSLCLISCDDAATDAQPAEGKVIANGQPAVGAIVTLHPKFEEDDPPPKPTGTVMPNGTFELTTYVYGDGAPIGEYLVSIVWPSDASTDWLDSDGIPEADGPSTGDRLNGKYVEPTLSGFTAEIVPGKNELPVFDVTPGLH